MLNDLIDKLAKTIDKKAAQVQQSSDLSADAVRELAEMADSLFKLNRANRIVDRLRENNKPDEPPKDWRTEFNRGLR